MTRTETATLTQDGSRAAAGPREAATPTRWVDRHGHLVEERPGLAGEVRSQLARRRTLGLFGSLAAADLVAQARFPGQREHLLAS